MNASKNTSLCFSYVKSMLPLKERRTTSRIHIQKWTLSPCFLFCRSYRFILILFRDVNDVLSQIERLKNGTAVVIPHLNGTVSVSIIPKYARCRQTLPQDSAISKRVHTQCKHEKRDARKAPPLYSRHDQGNLTAVQAALVDD